MALLEADVKRAMVQAVKDAGGYARRIEDQFSVGFPDVVVILRNSPVFFCEAKLIRGNIFAPSPRQLVEMKRMSVSLYSQPCLVGWKEGCYYINSPAETVSIFDGTVVKGDDFVKTLEHWYLFHDRQSKSR